MPVTAPDFTESERELVADLLRDRYNKPVHPEYIDLRRCVLTLLRVQTDHGSQSAGISSGATAVDLAKTPDDDEYHGPVVI